MNYKRAPMVAVNSIIFLAALILLFVACGPTNNAGDGNTAPDGNVVEGNPAGGTANTAGGTANTANGSANEDSPPTNPVAANLVFVPGSDFQMGSDEEDMGAKDDEMPQHTVELPNFFIFQTEVTNRMYMQCVEAGKCAPPVLQKDDGPSSHYEDPKYADHPVVGISWFQADAFCYYAEARLPTEAEWEKTSRGEEGAFYPWGDDIPSCDMSNYEACLPDPDTAPGDAYNPEGVSPYEAYNMAGNVGEWTGDWYDPEYYKNSSAFGPQGPALGKLKVVRGGGYLSSFEAVRSADREGFDPREGFEDTGFRCVPTGEPTTGFAPFCQPSYDPFCNPGGDPGTGIPLNRPDGDPNLTVVGFGCREQGRVVVSVDLGLPSANGYSVTVGGQEFTDCVEYPEYPGRLYCTGPAQTEGQVVTIEVCNEGNMQTQSQADPSAGKLVSVTDYWSASTAQLALQTYEGGDVNNNCPPGYIFDTASGACIQTNDGEDRCPAGWTLNPNTYQCEPDDDSSCPPGSTYDEKTRSCIPEDGEDCTEGYFATTAALTSQRSCEPDTNGGGDMCPRGYYFNTDINCCSPIPTTNYGCEEGFYYDTVYQRCAPITDDGCPYGYYYDRYQGCVPGDAQTSTPDDGPDDCPPGTYYDTLEQVCLPTQSTPAGGGATTGYNTTPRTTCDPGYIMNDFGQCEPTEGSGEDCGEGAYYDTYYQRCVETEDDCGLGYYYDQREQGCVPTDGPGSGCAPGYAFNARLGCCVPTPGNPGGQCPGDEEAGNGNDLQGPYTTAYYSQTPTSYNYDTGLCDPGGDGCPPGYYYDTGRQTCMPSSSDDCPDGTTYDTYTQTCRPDGDDGCPDGYYYDTGRDSCFPTGDGGDDDQCSDGYYFDYDLGYCVQEDDNGCALGYYATAGIAGCQPAPGGAPDDSGDNCPPGYIYDTYTESCTPLSPGTGECYIVTITVPVCDYTPTPDLRCPAGKRWNEKDQACIDRGPSGTEEPSCSSYGDNKSCSAGGCSWEYQAGYMVCANP